MSTAISVEGISKRYRLYSERRDSLRERLAHMRGNRYTDFWALHDVNLEVEAGQTYGVIGHNGSGKSTLLRLMAGIHRPTSGSIHTRGRVGALLELGAGFHPELSGRENVLLNGAILGLSRSFVESRMDDIVEFAGIAEFFDSPVKTYSTGMAARLGFATAAHVEPEILLVDEAISVGDEEFQRRCMDHLHQLRRAGTTVVLVSHALNQIADLCDAAVWLDHGRQQLAGPADQVIDAYLQDVNRRVGAAEPLDVLPERMHFGSGEIRIVDVEFLDPHGLPATALNTGEPCTVRLHYDAREPVAEVIFGLSFATETGTKVAGPNSGPSLINVAAGTGFADFHVSELVLHPTRYRVSAAAITRLHVIDHIEAGFDLTVHATHAITEPGLVRMIGDWTVTAGEVS